MRATSTAVKHCTLDLNTDFSGICKQLDSIVEGAFALI